MTSRPAKSSGMSRQTIRLSLRWARKFFEILFRCTRSITKMTSAHSMISTETGLSALRSVPAEATSNPSRLAKSCSAVGLRSLFCEQTNSTRVIEFRWNVTLFGSID